MLKMRDREKRDLAADIGDEVLDLDPGPAREAHIEERCGGDPQLAQFVREYLEGSADDFSRAPTESPRD
jgi:hypothetical protein